MFNNLAPVGLPSPSKAKDQRVQQVDIEQAVSTAISEFVATNTSDNRKDAYDSAHPDTIALVKSLDKFFAHGLVKLDKCYWSYVREFIPSEERVALKSRWNCRTRRDLSLAWLKDSLNRRNLQFQMFGFIASGVKATRVHYEKNACMRNMILLKKVCLLLDDIADLEFQIAPPYIFHIEETPIAVPISQVDGTMSPVDSNISSLNDIQFTPNVPLNIHRKRERELRSSIGGNHSIGSFGEIARNSYLDGLIDDLPEVNLSAISNAEPIVQSAKEQSYILDELLRNQRKGYSSQLFMEEEEEEEITKEKGKCKEAGSDSVRSLIPEDPCTSGTYARQESEGLEQLLISEKYRKSAQNEAKADEGAKKAAELTTVPSSSSLNSSELMAKSSSREDDELSALDENEVLLEGEIFLDSGEIIQLQLELCIKDGERVQRLFQVFTGHATGQPLVRYLLLTDQFIYLLAGVGPPAEQTEEPPPDLGTSPASAVVEEMAAEAFERNLMRLANGPPKKFRILIALPLCDLDHLTVGVDAQVLCFHSKRKKFRVHPQSGHEQRTFLVETASRVLGKTVAFAVQRTVALQSKAASSSNSAAATAEDEQKQQTVTPLSITASHSSQLGIVLKRFVRRELGIQKPEIVHLSLVYWQQCSARQQQEQLESTGALECYLFVRELYQRSWTRKGAGIWQQSYVVLRGLMLYQFSDSSFKFAQRSLNLRNCVEEVCHVDLKNDEKYTFQLTFSKGMGAEEGLSALQFSCPNADVMNKWIAALSLALSISGEAPLPVACSAILTETHILFAQEGMNCFVDGFMRSLGSFHIHECAEIFALRTDFNNTLVIRRDNGLNEWLIFRERSELDRMVKCLRQHWQLPVVECGDECVVKPEFNQLLLESAQMKELWREVPTESLQ